MTKAAARVLLFVVLAMLSVTLLTDAQMSCSPMELSACGPAIMSSAQPTSLCCAKLKQQTPCLCQYKRDPNLSQYVNSPGARRVASACHVSVQC